MFHFYILHPFSAVIEMEHWAKKYFAHARSMFPLHSQLILLADRMTGFRMIGTLVWNG